MRTTPRAGGQCAYLTMKQLLFYLCVSLIAISSLCAQVTRENGYVSQEEFRSLFVIRKEGRADTLYLSRDWSLTELQGENAITRFLGPPKIRKGPYRPEVVSGMMYEYIYEESPSDDRVALFSVGVGAMLTGKYLFGIHICVCMRSVFRLFMGNFHPGTRPFMGPRPRP